MKYVYLVVGVALATLSTIFAVQNAQIVQIRFMGAQFEGQLVVFLLGTLAAGALAMYLFTVPMRIKSALEIASLKKKLAETVKPKPII
jgi:uncharacterized integral membrane protein